MFFFCELIFEVVHIVNEEGRRELGEELKNGASNFESPSLIFKMLAHDIEGADPPFSILVPKNDASSRYQDDN